jgi:curved DNA-binding protein CbpA
VSRASQDFYAVLGVPPEASPEVLREAYTRLAKQCHPDLNPDQPLLAERFKVVTHAYAVLRDPQARARYDLIRQTLKGRPKTGAGSKKPPIKTPKSPTAAQAQAEPQAPPQTGPKAATKTQRAQPGGPQTQAPPKGAATQTQAEPRRAQASPQTEAKAATKNQRAQPGGPQTQVPPKGAATQAQSAQAQATQAQTAQGPTQPRSPQTEPKKPSQAADRAKGLKTGRARNGQSPLDATPKKGFWTKATEAARNFFSLAKSKAGSAYDISYRLAISSQAAVTGTTVSINYLRDQGQPQRLEIHIPPGVKSNSQLRLAGQGHLGPNQTRGDLVLTLLVMG